MAMWTASTNRGSARLSSQQFASAISYATCIERAARALRGLQQQGDPRNAIGAGRVKAELACGDQSLSKLSIAKRHPGLLQGRSDHPPEDEMKAYMLATIFSGMAYTHVIETSGWVTPNMRPCVRYLDGRPPSASCSNEPVRRIPSPPRLAPPPR
jgi:hypothetical protein